MPSARDFLERLRPSGTPGAASVSGVPADRTTERSAELEAVFALLADVQAEAEQIRSVAVIEAERRRVAAHERARAILSEARRSADAERAAAAAQGRDQSRAHADAIVDDARLAARTAAERARGRTPDFVEQVLDRVRADLADLLTDSP